MEEIKQMAVIQKEVEKEMTKEELDALNDRFDAIDKNGDGRLTANELYRSLAREAPEKTEDEINEMV
mgnify:CR=1 FL=1